MVVCVAQVSLGRAIDGRLCCAGFLGKSFSRHINRLWNYVVKGACGSVALVLGLTPVCLIVSALSLMAAVTAPVWYV